MPSTIYGIVDRTYNIVLTTETICDDLFEIAYKESDLWNLLEQTINDQFKDKPTNDRRDENEFYDDYMEDYFPDSDYDAYFALTKEASLTDIDFNEKAWQNIMIHYDNNDHFPAKNLCLISAEQTNQHELSKQRVDLLYLRSDGKIIPAEIKISDNGMDAHGQLIRYIAGFSKDVFTLEDIREKAKNKIPNNFQYIESFIELHNLQDKRLEPLETSGILICERFHHDTITAVRYLNEKTNLDIKMFDIDIFVDSNWTNQTPRFIFKAELCETV